MLKKILHDWHIPARTGKGFTVKRGDLMRITDLGGAQPCDFWAFNKKDIYEHLSCEHTKPSIEKLFPHLGDAAYTNHRRPIVRLVEDKTPGQQVYNPQHPDAGPDGNVSMPNVNLSYEMVDLITATRSYEANLTVVKNARQMAMKTLTIGK